MKNANSTHPSKCTILVVSSQILHSVRDGHYYMVVKTIYVHLEISLLSLSSWLCSGGFQGAKLSGCQSGIFSMNSSLHAGDS